MEITLALIKPHVLRNTYAMQQIRALISQNFTVLDQKEVCITKELSERFYAEHQGKFFYHRLTSFMNRLVDHYPVHTRNIYWIDRYVSISHIIFIFLIG